MNIAQAQRIKQALAAMDKMPGLIARVEALEKKVAELEKKRAAKVPTQ